MRYISILPIFLLLLVAVTPMSFAADLTLKTDSNSYLLGDSVIVSGNTIVDNTSLSIQIKDPGGKTILLRMVSIDSSGDYKLEFKIPSSGAEGNYEVIASVVSGGNACVTTYGTCTRRVHTCRVLVDEVRETC